MHVAARMVDENLDGALYAGNVWCPDPQQKTAMPQLLTLAAPVEAADVSGEKPQPLGRGCRALAVEQLARDLRQHTQRPEHANQRTAATNLNQIGVQQRRPCGLGVSVNDDGKLVGHIEHWQKLVH